MGEPSTIAQHQARPSPFAFVCAMPSSPLTQLQRIDALLAPIEAINVVNTPQYNDWDRCLAQFLRAKFERSQQSEGTLLEYSSILYKFFTGASGLIPKKHPEDYTYDDCHTFLHHHRGRHPGKTPQRTISAGTYNARFIVLSSFYKFASRYTVPDSRGRPTLLMQSPSPILMFSAAQVSHNYKAFTDSDIRKLFAVIPRDTAIGLRDRALFLFFFYTGRRREEIMRLRWRDITWGTITNEDGTSHEGWLYHFRGKGRSQVDDSAELPGPAKIALDAYLASIERQGTMQPGDALFYTHHSPAQCNALSGRAAAQQLHRYLLKAGIYRKGLSLHSFRHYFAQKHYLILRDPRAVQRLLRHKSLKTTGDYLDILMTSGDMAASRIEEEYRGL